MALNLNIVGSYILGGALVGSLYSLYSRGFFNAIFDGTSSTPPGSDPTAPPTTTSSSGQYAYYYKKKYQCRDAHLTFPFLVSQGVRVINYKIYNDGLIYAQVCNTPGPLMILVAIDLTDGQSGSILSSLGFIEYSAPLEQPNSNVPIPNPPSANYAMAYIGSSGQHNAYVSYVV